MSATRPTTVLITGANQGLGLETVRHLSKLPSYHIYLCARSAEAGHKAVAQVDTSKHKSSKVEFLQLDVDSDESIEEAAKKVPILDILINNAGINAMDDASLRGERKILQQIYETNVISVAIVTMAFMPALKASLSKERPRPSILMISSTLGSIGHMTDPNYPLYNADLLAYNSSKTALSGVARYFAKIFPEARVALPCPGYCRTNLTGFNGYSTAEEGARVICDVLMDKDGPTMAFRAPGQEKGTYYTAPW